MTNATSPASFLLFSVIVPAVITLIVDGIMYSIKAKDAKRRDARAVFIEIAKHLSRYQIAIASAHFKMFQDKPGSIDISGKIYYDAAAQEMLIEVGQIRAELEADCLLLRFVFDNRAAKLTAILQDVRSVRSKGPDSHVFDFVYLIPTLEELSKLANAEMERLWRSIGEPGDNITG